MIVSMEFAASTSSADRCAGPDAPWVSLPMNNGPVICLLARYSQIDWVIARICASFKLAVSGLPRWPLVPKLTS